MNPLTRLLCLCVLAATLPGLSLYALALVAALLLLAYFIIARAQLPRLLQGLSRLRWLFLAIFVLYFGYTPGDPWSEHLPGLSREGLHEGGRRALVLADLLIAVYLLLALTPLTALVQGLQRLLWPLRGLGLDTSAFARRLALALDQVAHLQDQVSALRRADRGMLDTAAELVRGIEQSATQVPSPSAPQLLDPGPQPRPWEWLLPPALALLLWWAPL